MSYVEDGAPWAERYLRRGAVSLTYQGADGSLSPPTKQWLTLASREDGE